MTYLDLARTLSPTRLALAGALTAIAGGALAQMGADAWSAGHAATNRAIDGYCNQYDCKGERAARIAQANAVTERRHAYTFVYQSTRYAEVEAFKAAEIARKQEEDAEKERQRLAALAEQERLAAQQARAEMAALQAITDPHRSMKF